MAAKDAISELYAIMRDHGASERDRLNAAISASTVEKLAMPGEAVPECITSLRKMVDDHSAPTSYRRESAARPRVLRASGEGGRAAVRRS